MHEDPRLLPQKDSPTETADPVRKRDAERTRGALLKSGLKEFSQNGFMGTRMEKVAKGAKVNIRMLYHYFGDKKGLYNAVLESAYAELRQEEARIQIDLDKPLDGMLELAKFTFLYFQNNPMFEGLLHAENMMQGKFVSKLRPVPEGGFALRKTIRDLIDSGQSKGLFRMDIDPVNIYVTMTALSRFHLANAHTMSAVLKTDLRDKAWREQRLQHTLDVITSYLVKPPKLS